MPSRAAVLAVLLLAVPAPARALDPGRALTQFGHDVWEIEHGLPQNTVYSIAQTTDGYLWLGTAEGLVRFDGVAFTVFDRRNTPEVPNNVVGALAADPDGSLWIGTDAGLVRRAAGRFEAVGEAGLRGRRISALAVDRAGALWVGTFDAGVRRRAGGTWQTLGATGDPALQRVRGFAEAADGMWIASEGGGLTRWRDGAPRTFRAADGLGTDRMRAVAVDAEGTVWAGTTDSGLRRWPRGGRPQRVEAAGAHGVWAIHPDAGGVVWVATMGAGVLRLHGDRAERLTTAQGLSDDYVWSIAEDREGSVWLGTLGGGLNRLRDGRFLPFGPREGLPSPSVRAVAEDHQGSVWIGTEGGGLSRVRGGAVDLSIGPAQGLMNDRVYSIAPEPSGALWVGGFAPGLDRVEQGRVASYRPPGAELASGVHAILRSRGGALWLGTFHDGLHRLEPGAVRGGRVEGRLTSWGRAQGLPSDDVLSLHEDGRGVLWIGTAGGGLARLEDGKITSLGTRQGFPSDFVYAIHEDAGGALWVGTFGGGLVRIAPSGSRFVFDTTHGLFDDVIYGLVEDGQGRLWMTSNRGIFRVARADLEAVAAGRRERVESVAYGLPDGLRSVECNAGGQPALRTRAGRLWFATVRGAVAVDPARLVTNPEPPPVHVERVVVDGRVLDASGTVELPPGGEQYEFAYTAPSFRAPSRVAFRYRLEGLGGSWVEAGTRRTAFYNRIPHGTYTFRVVASNEDGVWGTEGATVRLRVAPRFHETRWFLALAVLGAAALLWGGVRLRTAQLRAREEHLTRLVHERTAELRRSERNALEAREQAIQASQAKSSFLARMSHELRTPLNVILGFLQLMQQDRGRDPEERERLTIMRRSGEHLLGLVNDVLSLARIESGRMTLDEHAFSPRGMLREIEDMFSLAARNKGLRLTVSAGGGLPDHVRGDEGKLRQVLINLVGNAVKFTDDGGVALSASWQDGRARFQVEDTGPGIAAPEREALFQAFAQTEAGRKQGEGTGLGLAISLSFVRLMGGRLDIAEPSSGRGACFRLEVPLAPVSHDAAEDLRGTFRLAPGEPGRRLLVVDDSADNRRLLRAMLTGMGFEVEEARDGAEAVERWEAWRPDLVWMDLRMDTLDGYDATREIRRREAERGGRTPIVALTASALEEDRARVLGAGCDEIVLKPFTQAQIWQALARHLGVRFVAEAPEPEPAGTEAVAPSSLAHLPAEWRSELHLAVERADVDAARALVGRVRDVDPRTAAALDDLLRAYRFDEVLELTRPTA